MIANKSGGVVSLHPFRTAIVSKSSPLFLTGELARSRFVTAGDEPKCFAAGQKISQPERARAEIVSAANQQVLNGAPFKFPPSSFLSSN